MALLTKAGAAAVLVLALVPASGAAQPGSQVGRVVLAAPRVTGSRGGGPPAELRKLSPVFLGMEVETHTRAGTRIAINPDLPRKGMMVLGPLTTVQLTERIVRRTLGLERMSWLVKLGQFRLALLPPAEGEVLEEGELLIETPDGTEIRLHGTDVAVEVARDGTVTVWVLEGKVTVTTPDGGAPVPVSGGFLIRVRDGRPSPPVHIDYTDGGAVPPLLHPEETIFPDPPHLRRIRDLPKSRKP